MQERAKPLIFLFEDDLDIAGLIRFRLGREGYEVRHFPDGEKAMAAIGEEAPPDLVVTDVMMPFHDGFALVTAMRAQPAWATVPIIMLTSMGNEQNVLRGLRNGADDYLTKPFRPAELVARIRKLLGRAA